MDNKLRIPADDLNLLKALQRHGVSFVIIGGHAVRFHGVDREVEDLDVLVDSAGRAEDLRTAISDAVGDLPPIDVAEYGKPFKQIIVKRDGVNSDILTGSYGVEFAEVYKSAQVVEVDGLTLRVISKEHLISNKRAAKRGKDLSDVERLDDALEKYFKEFGERVLEQRMCDNCHGEFREENMYFDPNVRNGLPLCKDCYELLTET